MDMNKLKHLFVADPESDPIAGYAPQDIIPVTEPIPVAEPILQDITANEIDSVSKIYCESNLSEQEKSIFTVEDIKNALPNEMPTTTKQQSVLSLLKVSKIDLDFVLTDAKIRTTVLAEAKKIQIDTIMEICQNNQDQIDNLLKEIEKLKTDTIDKELFLENVTTAIDTEINRINLLVKFLTPEKG